jgi:hypothetical protein
MFLRWFASANPDAGSRASDWGTREPKTGFVIRDDGGWRITHEGRLFLDVLEAAM